MRILLVEEDKPLARSLELMLRVKGYDIQHETESEEALALMRVSGFDLVLLELELASLSGMEFLKQLRMMRDPTPVIIVSNLNATELKVKALLLGADDYVTKPFYKEELCARIHAVIRRAHGHADSVVRVGNLEVNLERKRVFCGETEVKFTPKEYLILELLALRAGTTITKPMFLTHLYGGAEEPEPKIIDVFMTKIRKKLGIAKSDVQPETVWGRGYVLRVPPTKT